MGTSVLPGGSPPRAAFRCSRFSVLAAVGLAALFAALWSFSTPTDGTAASSTAATAATSGTGTGTASVPPAAAGDAAHLAQLLAAVQAERDALRTTVANSISAEDALDLDAKMQTLSEVNLRQIVA